MMRRRRLASTIIAALLLTGAGATTVSVAHAAERPATITDAQVLLNGSPVDSNTQIKVGERLRFQASWSIAGQVAAGDTFSVPLPSGVQLASAAPFYLMQNGARLARCEYNTPRAGAILCTFEPGGPYGDPHGDIWFVASLQETEPGDPAPSWNIGGSPIALPVPSPAPTPGPWAPPFGTLKTGSGEIIDGRAVMNWNVYMWPGTGPGEDEVVTKFVVSDQLDSSSPNQPHTLVAGSFRLDRWQQDPADPTKAVEGSALTLPLDGSYGPASVGYLGEVFAAPTVNAAATAYEFVIDHLPVGYEYRLRYQSEATGAVSFDTDVFANTATVNGKELPAKATPTTYGGGGADASDYTSFTVSKKLTNNSTAAMPEFFELVVHAGSTTEKLQVPADGTPVNSGYFPAGAPITLCETPAKVTGVSWQKYTISGAGVIGPDAKGCYSVTGDGGTRVALTLTNVANAVMTPTPTPTPTPTTTPKPTPTTTPKPTPTTTEAPPATTPASPPAVHGNLASTGLDQAVLAVAISLAVLLIAAGGGVYLISRRRSTAG